MRPATGRQRVRQKACDGHRADAARHRRDLAGNFEATGVIDVAAQFAVRQTVDADIDDHGARLDHVAGDEFGFADRGNDDVGAAGVELP